MPIAIVVIIFIIAGFIALTLLPIILYFVYKDSEEKRDIAIAEEMESMIMEGYGDILDQAEEDGIGKELFERLRRKGYYV